MNRRDFMKVGSVVGAGAIVAAHGAESYANAEEQVSQ